MIWHLYGNYMGFYGIYIVAMVIRMGIHNHV